MRPQHRGPGPLRRRLARAALTAALTTTVVAAGHVAATSEPATPAGGHPAPSRTRVGVHEARAAALARRYDCSYTGLGPGVVPARAVVEVDHQIRVVDFDDGWAMYRHQRPGRLLSVCAR